MDYEEDKVTDQQKKMNGSGGLPAPEELRVPREPVHNGGRHRNPGEHRKRRHDKHHSKVGELLQRVVAVKPVRFRRQVEGCVVDEDLPCARNNIPRGRDEPLPLGRAKQNKIKINPFNRNTQTTQEMPRARHPDRVPVAGNAKSGEM